MKFAPSSATPKAPPRSHHPPGLVLKKGTLIVLRRVVRWKWPIKISSWRGWSRAMPEDKAASIAKAVAGRVHVERAFTGRPTCLRRAGCCGRQAIDNSIASMRRSPLRRCRVRAGGRR
jgi:hypothetical protein